jgi:hypothetical protein
VSKYDGRNSYRFRLLRVEFRRQCRLDNRPCWLCGDAIDYDLPNEHPECFQVDHAIPVSQRPDLGDDINNLRPSHRFCNERRGNNEPAIVMGVPSEQW